MENRPHEGFKGLSPSANRSVFMWAILLPILLLTLIFGREALPYLSGFLGAITLFSILRGQMRFLTKKWHFPRWLAAFLLILETLFLFLLPLAGIASMLIDLFTHNHIDLNEWYHQAVQWVDEAKEWIGVDFVKRDGFFVEQVLPALTKMGQTFTTKIVVGVYSLVVNSVVLLFVLYYMLYEREYFETAIRELLPFTEENKRILVSETQRIIAANAVGIPLIAIVQGGFAYLGYIFFGVEGALFYAVLTAFATIIPMVGTMVVYVPLALAFGFAGNWGSCIGLWIFGHRGHRQCNSLPAPKVSCRYSPSCYRLWRYFWGKYFWFLGCNFWSSSPLSSNTSSEYIPSRLRPRLCCSALCCPGEEGRVDA